MLQRLLRPEAGPLELKALDASQTQAMNEILALIARAVAELDERRQRASDYSRRGDLPPWLRSERKSRILILSGARGTGKTTLLLSILKACLQPRTEDDPSDAGWGRVRGRVVPLEPIDMEPLPGSTHLLVAILARVEAAVRWLGQRGSKSPDRHGDLEEYYEPLDDRAEALVQLQQLQASAVNAFDGNLPGRASRLDPDSYAYEVMRTESARLSLNNQLNEALDGLAEAFLVERDSAGPLFLLPVDDFDLNPGHCIDMLRLLRSFSVPRLFILVLGDVRVAETIFRLKVSGEISRIAHCVRGRMLPEVPEDVAGIAAEVASNGLRKMLPPSQRIELGPMEAVEAFKYRPLARSGPSEELKTLGQLLELVPLPAAAIETGRMSGVATLFDLLNFSVSHRLNPEDAYSGLGFFRQPPRRLADLWLDLNTLRDRPRGSAPETNHAEPDPAWTSLIEGFARQWRETIEEDQLLGPQERRELRRGIRKGPAGVWELDSLRVAFQPGRTQTVPLLEESGRYAVRKACGVRQIKGPPLVESPTGEVRRHYSRNLSPATGANHLLLYDLIVLGKREPTLFLDEAESLSWAWTVWTEPAGWICELPWPKPSFATYWEHDLARSYWNRCVQRVSIAPGEPGEAPYELLLWNWFSMAVAVLGRDYQRLGEGPKRTEPPNLPDWDDVVRQTGGLEDAFKPSSPDGARVRSWLVRAAGLLMPELGGLPTKALHRFARSSALVNLWRTAWRAIRRGRAERLAQLQRSGLKSLAATLRVENLDDKLFSKNHVPGQEYVRRLAEGLRIDEEVEESEFADEAGDAARRPSSAGGPTRSAGEAKRSGSRSGKRGGTRPSRRRPKSKPK
jgi:hypothetical protein